ncbi:protein NRT1/ PTR FAMILY 4.6 [Elaeis guineensis]|uniref:Protein NRT1/ PTR FAMILY 4.6 isoform X1 n=1 Tax=Elaeis guineensis var. tenera TaxID=51953 RepID=A0A6I9RQ90_ELAGV|nr:protein NRT1/ PTR FAMILY 4.6 isoform X1 [Elaeis guineensis]
MATQVFVDWKGNPVNKKRHGAVRSSYFIYFMVVMGNIAFVPNMLNLVNYLHGTMHMGISSSSTTVTNFIGAACGFALLGAFLSDSYITRFKTILIFGPVDFLGYALLALQAHLPSLHPSDCDMNGQQNNCEQVHGFNSALLYIALYTTALGEGCVRAALPSLGGDQFDDKDPVELQLKSSFFNWFTFGISLGGFIGLTLVVWIESNKGWDIGFGVSALAVLLGVLAVAGGVSFYRNQIPKGSPLTRIVQVFVAAFKNRKLVLPENVDQLQHNSEDMDIIEVLPHTKGFKFLDKASINHGDTGTWSCTVTQVEETKIILRMLPILISTVLGYLPTPVLLTFTVQQGSTMNTKLGKIHISPATLFVIPVIFQMVILVIYDQFIVPFARRITGYVGGITNLQRVGVGFAASALATCVAALVERKRKNIVEEHGLENFETGVPMSVFWLALQFFLLGIVDVTSFVGLLEFFNGEASRGMKSIGTAIFWCVLGLASLLGTFLVDMVNKATRHGDTGRGWLEGANLNKSHLDWFYWLVTVLELVALFNYMYWARRYVYRHDPRIPQELTEINDKDSSKTQEVVAI